MKKLLSFLLVLAVALPPIYVIVNSQFAIEYDGMDDATVTALINQTYPGSSWVEVDQATYQAFVAAHR